MFARFWRQGNNLQATREAAVYLFELFVYLGFREPLKWLQLHQVYAVLIKLIVCVFLPISFVLSYSYEYSKMTAVQLLTSLQACINIFGIPAKVFTIIVSMKHLRRALDVMDLLDARCHSPKEYDKIRHCAMTGNRLTIFYCTLYCVYVESTMVASLCVGKPAYALFIPLISWHNSLVEFVLHSFIEFVLINVAVLYQAGIDVYPVIYIYVIRTHMQILVERVSSLGIDLSTSNDEHYEQLVLCIKDHQNLLSLVDIISPVISITMFIQFTITALILGTTLINIFIFADLSGQIGSVLYLLAVLVQTSPCCFQATCLTDDSEQLALAIFHCKWIGKDIRFRKLMIYFMMRSQTPITLTALKLFPITLNTSVGIVKFSFSLYMFIKEMDFGQNLK
ncbi:odorant receptor 7a-like [Calliphora vicina]|uniref:odorant receptor 7a-like n=1 Tax=Calliphora vicina TaxID=7373 RepID=UPI00325A8DCB